MTPELMVRTVFVHLSISTMLIILQGLKHEQVLTELSFGWGRIIVMKGRGLISDLLEEPQDLPPSSAPHALIGQHVCGYWPTMDYADDEE